MRFDPLDNLFDSSALVWVAVGLVWAGVILVFNGLPWSLTKEGRAARRRHRERARNDPP